MAGESGLSKDGYARFDTADNKAPNSSDQCKTKCCGQPPADCLCSSENDPTCQNIHNREWHYRMVNGQFEVIFDRPSVDCCCNWQTAYMFHRQRFSYIRNNGGGCVQTIEGEGHNEESSPGAGDWGVVMHYVIDYVGGPHIEQDYRLFQPCPANGPYNGNEGCSNAWFDGQNGEWFSSCNEDYGWSVLVYPNGDRAVWSWYTSMERAPDDQCISTCFACCLPEGGCSEMSPAECAARGGIYQSGKHCDDASVDCRPQELGACCTGYPSYSCYMTYESLCSLNGGVWTGAGVPCTSSPCPPPPIGACCLPDGSCLQMNPAQCFATGGTWNAGGCSPNPCPQPQLGACCYSDGYCLLRTSGQCSQEGGAWAGPGTICDMNTCPTGACCTNGVGCVITSPLNCVAILAGTYFGDGTTCAGHNCMGCCCVNGQGQITTATQCAQLGGVFHGPDTTCVINPQPRPEGAGPDVPHEVDCSQGGGGALRQPVNSDLVSSAGPLAPMKTRIQQLLKYAGKIGGNLRTTPIVGGCSKCGDKGLF